MAGELAEKVCVVTGGARGIGAGICEAFVREGGRIAVLDQDLDAAEQMAARLSEQGGDAIALEADVRDENGLERSADRVASELGGVDVLINNAGHSKMGPTMTFPLPEWEKSVGVMQTGVFLCSKAFGRVMRDGSGGTIVNISSINGLTAFPGRLAYSAAKAAVVSMTELLAVEWANYGIRVNAVAPGITQTPMLDEAIEGDMIDPEAYIEHIPLRRFARVSEMAEAVLFLASHRSSYITGQCIAVDGGWTVFGWVPWNGEAHEQSSVGIPKPENRSNEK